MRGRDNHRGQGFRGGEPRGNGGGQGPGSRARGRGRGRGKGRGQGGYHTLDEMVQMDSVFFELNNRGSTPPRGRGSGRAGFSGSNTPNRGKDSPGGRGRGRGRETYVGDSPGRGRGRGRGSSKLRPGAPLSELLYKDRPYLRPVVFVRSVHTRTLFQEEEEILQPVVEEVGKGEQSHVPTADRVFRVFSGGNPPPVSSSASEDEQEASDDLEEIDFNDIDKLLHVRDLPSSQLSAEVSMVEEKFTGFYIDVNKPTQPLHDAVLMEDAATPTASLMSMIVDHRPASSASTELDPHTPHPSNAAFMRYDPSENSVQTNDIDESKSSVAAGSAIETPVIPEDEEFADFYIDTEPSTVVDHPSPTPNTTYPKGRMADSDSRIDDDDEVIVYVAPHPRSTRVAPPVPSTLGHKTLASGLSSTSILTGTTDTRSSLMSASIPAPAAELPATPAASPRASTSTSSLDNHSLASISETHTSTHTSTTTTQTPAASSTPISIPPAPTFSSISITPARSSPDQRQRQRKYQPSLSTPQHRKKAQAKIRKQEARAARKRAQRPSMLFGSFGAMMEEAQLQDSGSRDPRWEERRRGDSDVDWGDEDEGEGEGGGGSGGVQKVELEGTEGDSKGKEKEHEDGVAEGMDLDPELELDADAMRSFVQAVGVNGQNFMTMDDIADAEMMRREDEDGNEDRGSSGEDEEIDDDEEINAVLDVEEELLIAEAGDVLGSGDEGDDDDSDDEDTDDSDDELQSPKSNFQARLEHLRKRARSSRPRDVFQASSEDEDDDMLERNLSWAEEDEDFIAHIQSILDENEDVLTGRDRKEKNKLFRAVHNGTFEDVDGFRQARKHKDKGQDLPPDLQVQWQKDRAKKAEYKRQRALEKLAAAADPLIRNKGGKKGRKSMLAASKLDPTITVLPNRIIDMTTLTQQIRRFLADIDGPPMMSLPPTDKGTRKNIHDMAMAFGLKSQSKGKGNSRYTTLIKTSRSGITVDERKVLKITRMGARGGGGEFVRMGGRRGGNSSVPKHKEGDEVGKAAPKIGESNIGFKMLASMGWSEGDRIGITGGLDVPLTAVIKHTKLGLGASK